MIRACLSFLGFVAFVVVLHLVIFTFTMPWVEYEIPGRSDMLSVEISRVELPIWLGEVLRYTSGARTTEESHDENNRWVDAQVERYRRLMDTASPEDKPKYQNHINFLESWKK